LKKANKLAIDNGIKYENIATKLKICTELSEIAGLESMSGKAKSKIVAAQ